MSSKNFTRIRMIGRQLIVPIFLLTGMTAPRPAMAQNPGDQVALLCRYEGYGTLQYFYTDIIMIPKAITGYTSYGDPVDDRPNGIVLPEFKAHLTSKGYTYYQSDSYCGAWDTALKAQEWRDNDRNNKTKYGYTFNTLSGWRPSPFPAPVAASAKPAPPKAPQASGKRDSLIVRQIDEAPAKPVVAARKPVAKRKPAVAAKPAPKKKSSCKVNSSGQKVCGAYSR